MLICTLKDYSPKNLFQYIDTRNLPKFGRFKKPFFKKRQINNENLDNNHENPKLYIRIAGTELDNPNQPSMI